MVEYRNDHLDLLFQALADRTRRSLLEQVRRGPMRVTDLADKYEMSLNAVSKHIKVLEKAGLLDRNVEGRVHYCQANPKELGKVEAWLNKYQRFWNTRLDALEKHVTKNNKRRK